MRGTHGFSGAGLRRARAVLAAPLLAALAVLPAGCLEDPDDRRSGVDDFPNSIYARVEGFLDEKDKAALPAARHPDSLLAGKGLAKAAAAPVPALPAGLPAPGALAAAVGLPGLARSPAPLAKAAAECPATVSFTLTRTDPLKRARVVETITICDDELNQDAIPHNEHLVRIRSVATDTVSGRVETAELSDADGDGFLNPLPDGREKALASIEAVEGGVKEHTLIVAGFGPDGKWETQGDNLIYSLSWSRTTADGKDTLALAAYRDADGDGIAMDNAKPSLVDVEWYAKGPTADNPEAVWSRLSMRTVAVFGVKQGEIRRFAAESEDRDGRRNRAVLLGRDGGVDIDLRDTVTARFQVVGTAASDTVDTMTTTVRMTVGPDFDLKADDTVYVLEVRVVKKLGEERRARFDFDSDAPIPHGEDPRLGSLAMRIEYADGTALDVEGRLTAETLDVTAEMRNGKRIHAVWDREGRGLLLEELE